MSKTVIVTIRRGECGENGLYIATSQDVPGLYLAETTEEKVRELIPGAIAALLKNDKGEKPLCVNCGCYSRESPYAHSVYEHWCANGVNLITGAVGWVPCGLNRCRHSNATEAQGPVYDTCGPDGKYFVRRDT